ncbi:MAG TPA: SIS domain-containing protein, partial [Actinobacteria bacterium]|nr:SIS domain-containing protein [Actinomycetota bacterium]
MKEVVQTPNKVADSQLYKIIEYFSDMTQIIQSIDLDKIDRAIDILYDAWLRDKQVFIIGNGGSASTATHFTCDLTKTTIIEGKKRFKVISLVDNVPLVSALTNDEGFDKVFDEQLRAFITTGDVLIAISVHGGSGKGNADVWSQNLIRAIQSAKESGAKTIGLSGFDGGAMKDLADVCMVVPCESTPHVESLHLAFEHLLCERLQSKIK